ncbi:putative F-box protein At3g52320 [Papaver somniferum]|uniref:putative F-box protein At3g52320 n=1 Tax=Papaver somniferum TaxID=3469 RepID=UPI000E6FD467|nr:putative F-box protein At3g52320 [Papaver somniferum]
MADYLPIEIVLNILYRLPAETVLTCKRICKTWHNHLSHSDRMNFAKTHLLHLNQHRHDHNSLNNGVTGSKVSLGFIFLLKSENIRPTGHPLWHVGYDENNNGTVQKTLRPVNHRLIRTKQEYDTNLLVGSCNGLICFAEPRRRNVRDPIHICNPITRECVYLKGFNENIQYKSTWSIHSGFGYSPLTNEYKVVRILCYDSRDHGAIGQIQVYTLGSGDGWRNKGVLANYSLDSIYGVFC